MSLKYKAPKKLILKKEWKISDGEGNWDNKLQKFKYEVNPKWTQFTFIRDLFARTFEKFIHVYNKEIYKNMQSMYNNDYYKLGFDINVKNHDKKLHFEAITYGFDYIPKAIDDYEEWIGEYLVNYDVTIKCNVIKSWQDNVITYHYPEIYTDMINNY